MKIDPAEFGLNVIPLEVEPIIDDTTLRDGIQMPGLAVSPEDAATIAQMLDELGVERIELHHFQEPDKKAVKIIKDLSLNASIAGWCRAVKEDVDDALECGFDDIGISHPVSYIHFRAKWPDKTPDELLNRVVEVVEYAAKDHGLRVFVHGEDSTRADWNFEKRFINAVEDAGAECYRICDTVGVGLSSPTAPLPNGIPMKIKAIKAETKIKCVEIHAHDDFGNAVENTIAAIRAASGIWDKIYASTTFLGIGERAGNAETEKVIMNLLMHHGVKKFEGKVKNLKKIADFIGKATGYVVPPNKAIVGDYAFAHESGIHTHGVLRDALTYEPYPPELVGNRRRLTIGKHSGKAIVKHKIEEVTGQTPAPEKLEAIMNRIKEIYAEGRKASLREEEFRRILREFGLL
ncbi:MAG: 2-isopropylmalate synthase [Nitrososphaerota archaeon]|nr:2-isopropylmalate synthase [Candidatus Bathyarchaeota archaeon]MDW8048754.1 2-isopropylmalate synthase [Nitrososphaerota archaeon]